MTRKMGLTVTVLLLASACGDGVPRPGRAMTGSPAPAFQAVSLQGDTLSLESLRGSPVLLNLWATWCGPCRRETPYLQSLHQRFESRGLRIVGVSVDSRGALQDVEDFVKEFGVTYDILRDPEMRSMDLFSAIGLPATYIIGADGTILWMRFGPVDEGDRDFEDALESAVAAATVEADAL